MGQTWGDMERAWGDNESWLGATMNPGLGRHGTDMGRQWCCGFEADSPGLRLHNVMCFLIVCRFASNHQQLHRCVSERIATLHM